MAIISEKTRLQDLIRSMSILYDKFLTNRQYKDKQFKDNEQEYIKNQKALANEIKFQEGLVSQTLSFIFKEYFPNLEFLAYDSRLLYFNRSESRIGLILVSGIKNDEDENNIKKFFRENFMMEILVNKFEDLPEEIQKKFKK